MRFVTIRDLRSKPTQIWRSLSEYKDLILTSNGKPFAIITSASEETLENSLAMIRRIRAENAVISMQKRSVETGNDRISLNEINAGISAIRRARK